MTENEKRNITILPCPFCGRIPELKVREIDITPDMKVDGVRGYGSTTLSAWVECECGICTVNCYPSTSDESFSEREIAEALSIWNNRHK